jgi:hypothetical protein
MATEIEGWIQEYGRCGNDRSRLPCVQVEYRLTDGILSRSSHIRSHFHGLLHVIGFNIIHPHTTTYLLRFSIGLSLSLPWRLTDCRFCISTHKLLFHTVRWYRWPTCRRIYSYWIVNSVSSPTECILRHGGLSSRQLQLPSLTRTQKDSLARPGFYRLNVKLLLALASTVILSSRYHGTHNHTCCMLAMEAFSPLNASYCAEYNFHLYG